MAASAMRLRSGQWPPALLLGVGFGCGLGREGMDGVEEALRYDLTRNAKVYLWIASTSVCHVW
jgi:hypothetical protein